LARIARRPPSLAFSRPAYGSPEGQGFGEVKDREAGADHPHVVSDANGVVASELACRTCGAAKGAEAWCRRCLEPYERPAAPPQVPERPFDPPREAAARTYSRVKAGPNSFGLVAKLALSSIPAVLAFFAVRNVVRARHDPTVAYYLVIAVPLLVLVAGFLGYVWKRERIS
jgi:hypothetical protein